MGNQLQNYIFKDTQYLIFVDKKGKIDVIIANWRNA